MRVFLATLIVALICGTAHAQQRTPERAVPDIINLPQRVIDDIASKVAEAIKPNLPGPIQSPVINQQNPLQLFQPLIQFLNQVTTADLNAAIMDANAQTPPDTIGAKCWQDWLAVLPPNGLPDGAGLAWLVQKLRDLQTAVGNLNNDCRQVTPTLLSQLNNVMLILAKIQ